MGLAHAPEPFGAMPPAWLPSSRLVLHTSPTTLSASQPHAATRLERQSPAANSTAKQPNSCLRVVQYAAPREQVSCSAKVPFQLHTESVPVVPVSLLPTFWKSAYFQRASELHQLCYFYTTSGILRLKSLSGHKFL